jgi:hypothetical protein
MDVKQSTPFNVGMFSEEYHHAVSKVHSPKEFSVRTVSHSFANSYVKHSHYLKRKLYIARNVSYGLFCEDYCVGVCMFGFPVWREYPNLVPPLLPQECPELLRLCTMSNLPKNSESWFVGKCLRLLKKDWKSESGQTPVCVTSLCDNALGFSGALYKACNFRFFRKTSGRPSNPGGAHGKWGGNNDTSKAEKTMWVYWYNKKMIPKEDKK